MITHYLKIAARNLMKYKVQSAISIFGLATGIAFFIFGLHWLRYETSYDGFYPKADRTYQIYFLHKENSVGISPTVTAAFLNELCPMVETATASHVSRSVNFTFDDKTIEMPDFLSIDSTFIDIFPQQILHGRTVEAPREIIVSESFARKYWQQPEKAVGTLIKQAAPPGFYMPNPIQLNVVGVMADPADNSNFQYTGYYRGMQRSMDIYNAKMWGHMGALTHFTLKEGVSFEAFQKQLDAALQSVECIPEECKLKVIPISQKHFEFAAEGSFSYSAIGMFTASALLLLCCVMFNFLNLCLNRYYARSREMKLRKSMGASNGRMTAQLLTDITLQFVIGMLFCGCIIEVFLPFFEQTYSISIVRNDLWTEYVHIGGWTFVALVVIVFLPLVQFIRISTRQSLIGKPQTHRHHVFRRMSLCIQLFICLFFLVCTATLYRQVNFMQLTDLGFDHKHIIEMSINNFKQNNNELLEEIKRLPMIEAAVTSSAPILTDKGVGLNPNIEWEGQTEDEKKTEFITLDLMKGAPEVFNFRLIEGRTFREEDWTASADAAKDGMTGKPVLNKVLINETAARTMNMTNPVGKIIRQKNGTYRPSGLEWVYTDHEIIGVVKDLHPQGMKAKVHPTIIAQQFRYQSPLNYFKVVPGTEAEALKAIDALAEKYQWEYTSGSTAPVTLEHKLDELNKSETATFRLFIILAVLCMLISLFGIFSISSSTIQQRRKEIAIRKVMGASRGEIIGMFFREYSVLVCLSAVVAFPIAYLAMTKWLEMYAYHVNIGIPLFIVLLGAVIALVLITVLQQVLRAVSENPADVIKNE